MWEHWVAQGDTDQDQMDQQDRAPQPAPITSGPNRKSSLKWRKLESKHWEIALNSSWVVIVSNLRLLFGESISSLAKSSRAIFPQQADLTDITKDKDSDDTLTADNDLDKVLLHKPNNIKSSTREDQGQSSLTLLVLTALQVAHVCQAFILASAEMLHNNDIILTLTTQCCLA